jgi:hypothetical protein
VRVTLAASEVTLLEQLPEQLRALYEAPPAGEVEGSGDPVRDRLFPRAYLDPTAEAAEREWRALVHPELVRQRLDALGILVATLGRLEPGRRETVTAELGEEDVAAWLGVLNDARLALGTRLGITEDLDWSGLDPENPAAPAYAAYAWLTDLQGDLVEALLPYLSA